MNLYDVFQETVVRQPDALAVVGSPQHLSWSCQNLLDGIDDMADRLSAGGLKSGDVVGLHVESGADYIVASYAIWRCGACVVPIPFELKPTEKSLLIRDIAMDHIVSRTSAIREVDKQRVGDAVFVTESICIFRNQAEREHPEEFGKVNAAFIRFSSGTTSASKGVVLSHESIYERIGAANDVLRISSDDRVVWLLSMSYHFAVSIVSYMTYGATILLPQNQFADGVLKCISEHGGTFIYASPVHYMQLAQTQTKISLQAVRMAVSTTAGLKGDTAVAFQSRFNLPLTQAYGIIEIGLPCINTRHAEQQADAVGRVSPRYELRLESPDTEGDDAARRNPVSRARHAGRVLLSMAMAKGIHRRRMVSHGRYRRIKPRWSPVHLWSFERDDQCRRNEAVSTGGRGCFERSPCSQGMSCVRRSARLGEVPHARVVLHDTADPTGPEDLRRHCRERLTLYKVPKMIHFVDELERTGSGKLIRREIAVAATE